MSDIYYSRHVFMAAFELEDTKQFFDDKKDIWREEFIDDVENFDDLNEFKDFKDNYALAQYFNEQTKEIVFNFENKKNQKDKLVSNYIFNPLKEKNGAEYIIKIPEKEYLLNLEKIRLKRIKIDSKDIFLMMIYTRNEKYMSIEDIKKINQYGRRLYSPWIPTWHTGRLETESAEYLSFRITKNSNIYENNQCKEQDLNYLRIVNFEKNDFKKYIQKPEQSSLIKEILNYGRDDAEKVYEPKLIMPDRMFVGFLWRSNYFLDKLKLYNSENNQYEYLLNDKMSEELYSIIYIDNGDATCQSRTMREKLLKETIYDRWINWGTIHTITHNGLGCITTDRAPDDSVIMPFMTEYMEMMSLVLIQRIILLKFHEKATKLCRDFRSDQLQELQKEYVKFKTQFLLFEVTPQEQGYEIYRIMQKQLYVDEEKEKMDDIMNSLYEIANVEHNQRLNKQIHFLTNQGIFIAMSTLVMTVIALSLTIISSIYNDNLQNNIETLVIAIIISLSIIIYILIIKLDSR